MCLLFKASEELLTQKEAGNSIEDLESKLGGMAMFLVGDNGLFMAVQFAGETLRRSRDSRQGRSRRLRSNQRSARRR